MCVRRTFLKVSIIEPKAPPLAYFRMRWLVLLMLAQLARAPAGLDDQQFQRVPASSHADASGAAVTRQQRKAQRRQQLAHERRQQQQKQEASDGAPSSRFHRRAQVGARLLGNATACAPVWASGMAQQWSVLTRSAHMLWTLHGGSDRLLNGSFAILKRSKEVLRISAAALRNTRPAVGRTFAALRGLWPERLPQPSQERSEPSPATEALSAGTGSGKTATPEQRKQIERILSASDHYGVLDLEQSCTSRAVKAAFRRLSLMVHPDKCNAPDTAPAFLKVQEAHSVLSGAERDAYDAKQAFGGGGSGFTNPWDQPYQAQSHQAQYRYEQQRAPDAWQQQRQQYREHQFQQQQQQQWYQQQQQQRHRQQRQRQQQQQQYQQEYRPTQQQWSWSHPHHATFARGQQQYAYGTVYR